MHISIMDLQGKEQGNRSCDHQSARKIMPVFPIEFTAQSTIHQRQIIQVEADSIEDAIEAVQSYDIDNSQATDLGKPIFTEWLVDDVKAYDPNNSPLALPSTCIDHQAQLAAQKPLLYQIGRAHVCTPVTNAPLVCRLLIAKKKIIQF